MFSVILWIYPVKLITLAIPLFLKNIMRSGFLQISILAWLIGRIYLKEIIMYSKIGSLIWREMKIQGYTQLQLAEKLEMPGVQLSPAFRSEKMDVHLLVRISKVLQKNFFQDITVEELDQGLNLDTIKSLKSTLADLSVRNHQEEKKSRQLNRQLLKLQKTDQEQKQKIATLIQSNKTQEDTLEKLRAQVKRLQKSVEQMSPQ